MPADHYVMDSDMKKVADSIRAKGGTTDPLTFPDGMVQAINDIQAGGGHEAEDEILQGTLKEYTNDRITTLSDYAFYKKSIVSVSFPNVQYIGYNVLDFCTQLTSVYFPKLEETKGGGFGFSGITTLDLPQLKKVGSSLAHGCENLTSVNLPKATRFAYSVFEGCTSLVSIDLPLVERMDGNTFNRCNKLEKVIIRTPKVCEIGDGIFKYGADLAQVYVPDNLVSQYKTATNWSEYASRIHPISELP